MATTSTRLTTTTYFVNGIFDEVTFNSTTATIVNLHKNSQSFGNPSSWITTRGTSTNNISTAPDLSVTACKVASTVSGGTYVYQPVVVTSGTNYVWSIFAKYAGHGQFTFRDFTDVALSQTFDVTSGTIIGTVSGTYGSNFTNSGVISAGNGWYRCFVSYAVTATSGSHNLSPMNLVNTPASPNGTDGVLFWGAQLEPGTAPTIYQPTDANGVLLLGGPVSKITTNTVYVSNIFDEVTFNATTPTIVNIESYSQDFTPAYWSKTNITISSNTSTTTAPDGTFTATKIQETTVTNYFALVANPTATTSTAYTMSVYAKAAERNILTFNFSGMSAGGSTIVYWNLTTGGLPFGKTNGSIYSNISSKYVGNGWWRCWATFTTLSSGAALLYHLISQDDTYVGTAGYGIYVWGAQLEKGSNPTVYQPKNGANTLLASSTARKIDNTGITYISGIYDEVTGI